MTPSPRIRPYDTDLSTDGPDDDLWFLPGPDDAELLHPLPGPRPQAAPPVEWAQAEAALAAPLARVAARLGALDERLRHGPAGWRHRLALLEAAELAWFNGDRITPDRLALWIALRHSAAQADTRALGRAAWAVRRLTGGGDPLPDLPAFLDRRDPDALPEDAERVSDQAHSWAAAMAEAQALHPITRACMGFHLWALAGLSPQGDRIEAAVTAARLAASETQMAVFAPLALGGTAALRGFGSEAGRLAAWLDGMGQSCRAALRHLDDVAAWDARATADMASLSGRTPPALRALFAEWPMVSAPMAEAQTGASRAAVQRNLAWMEARGLIREVTGQGRFRMWRISV